MKSKDNKFTEEDVAAVKKIVDKISEDIPEDFPGLENLSRLKDMTPEELKDLEDLLCGPINQEDYDIISKYLFTKILDATNEVALKFILKASVGSIQTGIVNGAVSACIAVGDERLGTLKNASSMERFIEVFSSACIMARRTNEKRPCDGVTLFEDLEGILSGIGVNIREVRP